MIDRKKLLIIGIAVVGVIFLITLLSGVVGRPNQIDMADNMLMPDALATTATPYDDDTVLYSNGRALATYNYVSGETKAVSPQRAGINLGVIDNMSVSGDKQFALFHTNVTNPGGLLDDRLKASGLDTSLDYWWVYSFAQQTFTALPQSTSIARFGDNTVHTLSGISPNQKLTTYTPSDVKPTSTISVNAVSNFYPSQKGYILETSDNDILVTQDGVVSTSLIKSASIAGVTQDSQNIVVSQHDTESSAAKLVIVPISDPGSAKTVSDNIQGAPALSPDDTIVYGTPSDSSDGVYDIYSYDMATEEDFRWLISGADKDGSVKSLPVTALDSRAAIFNKSETEKFLVGNGLAYIKATDAEYIEVAQVGSSQITIVYDNQIKGYSSYPTLPDKQAQLNGIKDHLKQDEFNSDLYRIRLIDATD